MSTLEITLFVIVMFILTTFALFEFIKKTWYTKLESGNVAYIYRGETLIRIIADVRGKKLVGYKLVPLASGEKENKTWINRQGFYWMGFSIPYITLPLTVKSFEIEKKKEVEITAEMKPTEWIKDLGKVEVHSLRAAFPRPFLLVDVELGSTAPDKSDRQAVTLRVTAKFEVVDVYIPVVELKGDFFGNAGSITSATIGDILKGIGTIDDFFVAQKGEDGILKGMKDPTGSFNENLEKQVGLNLTGIVISAWEPSNKATREALSKKFLALKDQERQLIEVETYKKRVAGETEADALRITALGVARGNQIKEMAAAMASTMGKPDIVAEGLTNVLRAEALTGPTSKITTLVDGKGDVQTVLPIGGGK